VSTDETSIPAPLGRPRADELIAAVREFLTSDVLPSSEGLRLHQLRVAINALAVVERELRSSDATNEEHHKRLASLHMASDAELVAAIRDGQFDDDPALRNVLELETLARLSVNNPRWIITDDNDD
jgi:Domain of unknown function (DUF6285)